MHIKTGAAWLWKGGNWMVWLGTWPERTELGHCKKVEPAKISKTAHLHCFDSLGSWVVKLSSLTNGQASRPQHQHFGYLDKTRTTNKCLFLYCNQHNVTAERTSNLCSLSPPPGFSEEQQVSLASQKRCPPPSLSLSERWKHQTGTIKDNWRKCSSTLAGF